MTKAEELLRIGFAAHSHWANQPMDCEECGCHETNFGIDPCPVVGIGASIPDSLAERLTNTEFRAYLALKVAYDQLVHDEVQIDGEWGHCREIEQLYADRDVSPALLIVMGMIREIENP